MKITNDQYAKLLYEISKTSDEKERAILIKGAANLMKKNGDVAKLNNIEIRYQTIKQKSSGQLEGIVYTANKLEEKELDAIRKAIAVQKDISNKLISLKNEINPDLKGGFVVKFENEILDGSLEGKINRVKKSLVI